MFFSFPSDYHLVLFPALAPMHLSDLQATQISKCLSLLPQITFWYQNTYVFDDAPVSGRVECTCASYIENKATLIWHEDHSTFASDTVYGPALFYRM